MNTTKCMNPACNKPSKNRGLCVSCYQAARRLVVSGRTTWELLVIDGKCEESKIAHENKKGTTINWLLHGSHIDELEFQETGKITCKPNSAQ